MGAGKHFWTIGMAALLGGSPALALTCPPGYVLVAPTDSALAPFCVAKYEMSSEGGVAVSRAGRLPWSDLTRFQAVAACQALGPDFDLISNREWQEVAHQIEATPANWSGGGVGSGALNVGHASPSPAAPLPTAASDDDACAGTGETCDPAHWSAHRRTHQLPNGVLWDFSGNLSEWVSDNNSLSGIYADSAGDAAIRGTPFLTANYSTRTDFSASPSQAQMGFGRIDLRFANGAVARGSDFETTDWLAGIFTANATLSPDSTGAELGFRCVQHLAAAEAPPVACPAGYVAVGPSDPSLKPFCVAKYEAKDAGGVAASRADSAPWTTVSRPAAIAACAANGAGYDLIRNSEWQAVAREIESIPANWSSGQAGTGSLAVGNTSYNSFTTLAASADDRQPCFGTGHVCDTTLWDQAARTQKLQYGVIWDLNGNVSEWVKDDNAINYHWSGYASEPGLASVPLAGTKFGSSLAAPAGDYSHGLGFLGLIYANGGIVRGGNYGDPWSVAGIYKTDLSYSPENATPEAGFRCVFRPYGDPGDALQPAPLAPVSFRVVQAAAASLSLAWSPGDAITTGYRIAYATGATAPPCGGGTELGAVTTFQAAGLKSSSTYAFSLCAVNALGTASPAATLIAATAALEPAPPAPTSFAVDDRHATSISFRWKTGGKNTAGFRFAIAEGAKAPSCESGKALGLVERHRESGLKRGTSYSVALCAQGAAGTLSVPVVLHTKTRAF